MNHDEYIQYAISKGRIEYHSYSSGSENQCVDLVNDYISKVWKLNPIIGTNAKDFPEKIQTGMEYIKNTKEYLPNSGEIAVWNGNVGGGAGHVSIVINKGTQTLFDSIDQNWSKKESITFETHNYSNVLGFIRRKVDMPEVIQVEKNDWERARKSMDILSDVHKKLGLSGDHIDIGSSPYMEEISRLYSRISSLGSEIEELKNNPVVNYDNNIHFKVNGKTEKFVNKDGIEITINYEVDQLI